MTGHNESIAHTSHDRDKMSSRNNSRGRCVWARSSSGISSIPVGTAQVLEQEGVSCEDSSREDQKAGQS